MPAPRGERHGPGPAAVLGQVPLRPHGDLLERRPERLRSVSAELTATGVARLRRLEARYDPDDVFDRDLPIPPAVREDAREPALGTA